jgi:hypothetical protein
MSHGFMVWSVDTSKLRQVPGSKDDKLRRMIGGRFKRDLAALDDLFDHQIAAGGPNTYEALRQIVDGTIPAGVQNGAIYRYAFKLIVEHFGTFLDNSAVYPWRGEFGDIDDALADVGLPFKLGTFYGTDLPVDLPRPDDFPLSGWVDEAAVRPIHAAPAKHADRRPRAPRRVDNIRSGGSATPPPSAAASSASTTDPGASRPAAPRRRSPHRPRHGLQRHDQTLERRSVQHHRTRRARPSASSGVNLLCSCMVRSARRTCHTPSASTTACVKPTSAPARRSRRIRPEGP